MKKALLTFLILGIGFSSIAGGPWTQGKGKGYFKISEWWLIFDKHFTDTGALDPNVTTGIFNTAVYAEFGFTDRLTTTLYAPIFSRTYMNNLISETTGEVIVAGEALNSIGDADLGIKYGITKPGSKIPVAASLILGLPLGETAGGDLGNLQTGDGEFNQQIRLDVGRGLKVTEKISGYASAYGALNNRSEGFSDEYRLGIEAGMGFLQNRIWGIARIDAVRSFRNGEDASSNTSTSIFANNTEYTSSTLEINAYLTETIGLSAAVGGAFDGKIIAAAPSYSLGIFLDLSK